MMNNTRMLNQLENNLISGSICSNIPNTTTNNDRCCDNNRSNRTNKANRNNNVNNDKQRQRIRSCNVVVLPRMYLMSVVLVGMITILLQLHGPNQGCCATHFLTTSTSTPFYHVDHKKTASKRTSAMLQHDDTVPEFLRIQGRSRSSSRNSSSAKQKPIMTRTSTNQRQRRQHSKWGSTRSKKRQQQQHGSYSFQPKRTKSNNKNVFVNLQQIIIQKLRGGDTSSGDREQQYETYINSNNYNNKEGVVLTAVPHHDSDNEAPTTSSLDQKIRDAMKKLGLTPTATETTTKTSPSLLGKEDGTEVDTPTTTTNNYFNTLNEEHTTTVPQYNTKPPLPPFPPPVPPQNLSSMVSASTVSSGDSSSSVSNRNVPLPPISSDTVTNDNTKSDNNKNCEDGICIIPKEENNHETMHADANALPQNDNGDSDNNNDFFDRVQNALQRRMQQPQTVIEVDSNDSTNSNQTTEIATLSASGSSLSSPTVDDKDVETNVASDDSVVTEVFDPVVVAAKIAKEYNIDVSIAMAALGATASSSSSTSSEPQQQQQDGDTKKVNHVVYNEKAAREMIQYELQLINQISEDCVEVQQLVQEGYDTFLSRRALAFSEMNVADARAILQADIDDEHSSSSSINEKTLQQLNEKEQIQKYKQQSEANYKSITVQSNFDPTTLTLPTDGTGSNPEEIVPSSIIPSSNKNKQQYSGDVTKESVIFDATAAQLQELVLESPVPVLLDVYATWCGPCKALTPILEEITMKAGGALRLVKINSDNERTISNTLQVTALPTIFAIRDGQIMNMFQGMPKSEDMFKNFVLATMVPTQSYQPLVTIEQQQVYKELSIQLTKIVCMSSFPFSLRETLYDRTIERCQELYRKEMNMNMEHTHQSIQLVRTLLQNIIQNPYEIKYRTIKVDDNKRIAQYIRPYKSCMLLLKSAGFYKTTTTAITTSTTATTNSTTTTTTPPTTTTIMTIGNRTTKVVNVAPLMIIRDAIDKWIEKTHTEARKAEQKRLDDERLQQILLSSTNKKRTTEETTTTTTTTNENDSKQTIDVHPNQCTIRVRIEGKKKVHELVFQDGTNDTLESVLQKMMPTIQKIQKENNDSSSNINNNKEYSYQITCVSKRLVVSSVDTHKMKQSLQSLQLTPSASLVIAINRNSDKNNADEDVAIEGTNVNTITGEEKSTKTNKKTKSPTGTNTTNKKSNKKKKKKKKGGSHTMQSVGIYAKDDHLKGELIDGGGGTLYEHDVGDDDDNDNSDTALTKSTKTTTGNGTDDTTNVNKNNPTDDDDAAETEARDDDDVA